MKTRIIGFILIALVLGGMYVATESGKNENFPTQTQQADPSGLQGLKIN